MHIPVDIRKYRVGLVVALALVAALLCFEIVREVGTLGQTAAAERPAEAASSGRIEAPVGPRPTTRRVDYSDEVGMGDAPLMPVGGLMDYYLSPNFTISDFASSDSAGYVRIAHELVDALEIIRAHLGTELFISSGYRHNALNASERVAGAGQSQHIAGRAADIASPDATPLDVARAALEALGCSIGIGLGETFVHVDVRGELASWTGEGAAMDEEMFDAWAPLVCSGADPEEIEAILFPPAEPPVLVSAEQYEPELRAYARLMRRRSERGVVVLDVSPVDSLSAPYRLSALAAEDSLVAALGLNELVEGTASGRYFVYVVRAGEVADFGVGALE